SLRPHYISFTSSTPHKWEGHIMDQMWSATFDPRNLAVRFGGRGKAYLCPYPYRPSKEPCRRVRYDRSQLIPEVFLVEMCAVFLKEGLNTLLERFVFDDVRAAARCNGPFPEPARYQRSMRHSPVAKQSFGGLERFDESKPMILPLSIERPSQWPIS